MKITRLHPLFGAAIHDLDPRNVTPEQGYPEIRQAFEEHSLLLFPQANLTDAELATFAALFGPVETQDGATANVLSNQASSGEVLSDAECYEVASARANQLWHTDRIYFDTPALANFLTARVVPKQGGETEFVSTRVAWAALEPDIKEALQGKVLRHHFAHSRGQISKDLADHPLVQGFEPSRWRAVWPNPVSGDEALYIASHTCGVEGLDDDAGAVLIAQAIDAVTAPDQVYRHNWKPGDLLVWDERATMHRGRPWDYSEPRVLVSTMVLAQESDGIASVRP